MALTDHDQKTFVDHMNGLQTREKVVADLAILTTSTRSTVYRWINGQVIPPALKQNIIANYFGISVEELFPKSE